MKVPLERNSAGLPAGRAALFATLYFRFFSLTLFSLSSSSSFVPSKAWIHEPAPQLWKHCLARQGSPGSREAPLQMLEIPVFRASSASARAAFPPLFSSAFSILLYWTCRIKSRTRHRTPRHKRTFEIIPGEIGPITVGVPLQIFRLATDRGPVELGIARRDP